MRSPRIGGRTGSCSTTNSTRRSINSLCTSRSTSVTTSLMSNSEKSVVIVANEIPQPGQDGAGAPVVLDDVFQNAIDLVDARLVAVDQALAGLGVAQDRGQRLIEFMRNGAGQLAQGRDTGQVNDLPAQLLRFLLQRFLFGDVGQGAGETRHIPAANAPAAGEQPYRAAFPVSPSRTRSGRRSCCGRFRESRSSPTASEVRRPVEGSYRDRPCPLPHR